MKNSALLLVPSVPGVMMICVFSPGWTVSGVMSIIPWFVFVALPVMPRMLKLTAPVMMMNAASSATCLLFKSIGFEGW